MNVNSTFLWFPVVRNCIIILHTSSCIRHTIHGVYESLTVEDSYYKSLRSIQQRRHISYHKQHFVSFLFSSILIWKPCRAKKKYLVLLFGFNLRPCYLWPTRWFLSLQLLIFYPYPIRSIFTVCVRGNP